MKSIIWGIFPVLFLLFLGGCKDRIEVEDNKIADFLDAKGWTAQKTESGLYYIIDNEGTGTRPEVSNTVKVHYKGYLLNEKVFDSSYSRNEPLVTSLTNVIAGWQEGIPLLKEGGKAKLIIPSRLGYGDQKVGDIPKNSVLVFEVELIEVN